jgi:hypothetical protein
LVYNLNGWNMPPQWLGQNQFNKGNLIQFAPGTSFLQVSHLTAINIRGATPWLGFFVNALIGGFSYINNAVEYSNDNGDGGFYYSEACGQGYYPTPSCNTPSLNGATNGTLLAALHGLKFGNNVIIPAWLTSDPGAPKEYGSTEITNLKDSFRGYVNYFPADDTHGERVKAVKFHDSKGNFRLSPKSPYISGAHLSSDGMPIGVDMDKLEVAQGHVSNVRVVGVPSTSTTLAFLAPDTFGCQVDWSTNSFNTFTRVANAGGQRNQSVVLTLPAHTTLTARVDCAVEQAKITIVVP